MRIYFVILCFLLCGLNGFAQQFHFKQFSLAEGLSRSGVYDILQDDAGFLWIATEGGGLCKFDGKKFEHFNRFDGLASEKIRVIFQDDQGTIWFGTTNGLSYYDGVEDFYSITMEDGLTGNFIRSVSQDHEGDIWVGTDRGISTIDPIEKVVINKLNSPLGLPDTKVRTLLAQGESMWIGTDLGLCKYSGDKKIETVINKKSGLSDDLILTLFLDEQNALWVGTENGLNRIEDNIITSWTEKDGLISNRIKTITQDHKKNLWIGTAHGISVFNEQVFLNLNEDNGLSNERIRCLIRDNFDNIWIGTYFGGIMRFNHQDFVAYTPNDGLISNQIYAITEDHQGDIVVGTYDGVSTLKTSDDKLAETKTLTTDQGLLDNAVHALLIDNQGYYWYGTSKGITISKGANLKNINKKGGLPNNEITVIRQIDDEFWIGTKNGLAIITTNDHINYKTTIKQISSAENSSQVVSEIREDQNGNVWVSYSDGGLLVFKDGTIINPLENEDAKEIMAFTIDSKNQFWIGTNGNGLFYGDFNEETNKLELKNLSTKHYLKSNYIFSIQVKDDHIWLGHENGLGLITQLTDSTFNSQSYGPDRGFFGLQNNRNASFEDSHGNLWFGTVNGLFCLKNDDLENFTNGKPSTCYIQSIKINSKFINWQNTEWCDGVDGIYNLPKELALPYDENNISFEFIGLNYISPNNITYSWKLEGFDKDWRTETTKNYTAYTNLDPGKYTFMLRSSNEHGKIINDSPITQFTFKIKRPWWSTWLVRILAIILAIALISGFISLRTRQLRKKQRTLEQTIQERTVEITRQKEELEFKNSEITDSILYSRRIQHSILPGPEKLNGILAKHFIFYKPKDIVSGDFYWVERSLTNSNLIHLAVADCTGHGVPGAMVSLVGTRALNSSVREKNLSTAAHILDATNEIMLEAFTDAESGTIIKDGMDIALCTLDYTNPTHINFQFSGAQNPVWIVRKKTAPNVVINEQELEPNIENETYKLFEIKGSKQPIGYFENHFPFENHMGTLVSGDRIYLNSDGYADQFGGPNGKKFKYKKLKQLVLNIQNQDIQSQRAEFKSAFFNWMGELEQLDDVCLLGFEI